LDTNVIGLFWRDCTVRVHSSKRINPIGNSWDWYWRYNNVRIGVKVM